jgi:hypothetical protein
LTKHWIMSWRQQFAYVALPKQCNRHPCLQSGSIQADRVRGRTVGRQSRNAGQFQEPCKLGLKP